MHRLELGLDAHGVGPVELYDQHRLGAGREGIGLAAQGGVHGDLVHGLQRARQYAGADNARDGPHGRVEGGESRRGGLDMGRQRQDLQPGVRNYAQGAFRAYHYAHEVGALVAVGKSPHLALGGHYFQLLHVVGRDAVLEAERAARVLADVAADGGDLLAGRVRGVKIAERLQRLLQFQVDHAGLHQRQPRRGVYLPDLLEARQVEDGSALQRYGAAREVGAGQARQERDPGPEKYLHYGGHLPGGGEVYHHLRPGARHAGVVGVHQYLALVGADVLRPYQGLQFRAYGADPIFFEHSRSPSGQQKAMQTAESVRGRSLAELLFPGSPAFPLPLTSPA